MRNSIKLALVATASLALAACSEKTQDSAENTVEAASQDVAGVASEAAADGAAAIQDVATDGAAAVSNAANTAAGEAARATGKLGDKISEGAARVESDVQNEPRDKSKQD